MKLHLKYTEPQLEIFHPETPSKYNVFPKGRRFDSDPGAQCIIGLTSDAKG